MSDPTGAVPAEGAAATPPPAADPTPAAEPWAPVLDRVNELAGSVGQIGERFASFEQRLPQPEPEQQPDPWQSLIPQEEPEQYYDQYGNPVDMGQFGQQQQALDPAALQQAVNAAIQQQNAPLVQQLQAMQMERGREQLYQEIPQLKDPEVARETERAMTEYLQQTGAPQQVVQWMINTPKAISQFFKAAEAEKLAKAQVPAGENVPSLESAGGAVPGGDGSQPSIVEQAYANRHPYPKGF
jgi:hypothetical protein